MGINATRLSDRLSAAFYWNVTMQICRVRVAICRPPTLAWTLALSSLFIDAPSYAAAPSAEDLASLSLTELSKIDVTAATLFEHNDLNTPASVNVVTEEEWQRNGARRATDAFGHLASLYSIPLVFSGQGVSIRGLPPGERPGVLTTLDGVPIIDLPSGNTFQRIPSLNLGALQSMQIVRGPGSALYGTDAFHGVIAMQSFQARDDMASANGFAASDGYYQSTARLSRELGAAGRASAAVSVNGQPDQRVRYSFTDVGTGATLNGERENRYNAQSAVLNFNSNVEQDWSYNAGLFAHHYDANDFPGFGTAASGERDTSDFVADFYLARVGVNKRFAEHGELVLTGYYWDLVTSGTRFAKNAGVFTIPVGSLHQDRFGVKAVYKEQLGDSTQIALALSSEQQAVRTAKITTLSESGVMLGSVDQLYANTERKTQSLTFEGNTEFFEHRMSATYGARCDTFSDTRDHVSPRLGLIYHPQKDAAIKLLYGHAFRAPVAIDIYGAVGSIQGNPNLQPETLDAFELVWLKQADNWRVQIGGFHSAWANGIVNIPNVPPPPLRAVNLGGTDANGVELEWRVQLQRWSADSSAIYVTTNSDLTGAFNTIPKSTIVFGVGYALPALHADIYLNQRLQSHVDDSEPGASFVPSELPTYWRSDLQMTKRLSANAKLWLSARNLFARNNRVPTSPAAQLGVQDDGFSVGVGIGYGW